MLGEFDDQAVRRNEEETAGRRGVVVVVVDAAPGVDVERSVRRKSPFGGRDRCCPQRLWRRSRRAE
jgi:hypothetical protein